MAIVVTGLSMGMVACGGEEKAAEKAPVAEKAAPAVEETVKAEAPGESGFVEIPIDETIVGPYQVAAVYFQGVDMIPEG